MPSVSALNFVSKTSTQMFMCVQTNILYAHINTFHALCTRRRLRFCINNLITKITKFLCAYVYVRRARERILAGDQNSRSLVFFVVQTLRTLSAHKTERGGRARVAGA